MKNFLCFFLLGLCTLTAIPYAIAQDWVSFESENTLHRSRMPPGTQEKNEKIYVSKDTMSYSGEALSIFDQRPFKNSVKSYILKIDQTIGLALTDEEIPDLINEELDFFKDYYAPLGGKVLHWDNLVYQSRMPGGEIMVSYKDPEFGEQSIRARVFFSDTSKFQQMIVGNRNVMNSMASENYFESFVLRNGRLVEEETIEDKWKHFTSPLGIFTARLPVETSLFMPKKHNFRNNENVERLSLKFVDPLWKHALLYNVYGYDMNKKLFYDWTENMLKKKFVAKHVLTSKIATFRRGADENGIPTITAEYFMKPPAGYPYMNRVKLKAQFINDHAIVHEIMGTGRLVRGPLANLIMKEIIFHKAEPERFSKIKRD